MQDLHQLNVLSAVAQHRSFAAAARELQMSPSALSHAVAALEQRLGVRLFNRTTRSVSLSEAGERFLARIRPALREIASAAEELDEQRDKPAGTLRINASETAARLVLWPMVRELRRRFPEVSVELASEDRLVDIVADGFDCGVRTLDAVPRDMIAVPCSGKVRFAVAGSKGYFKHRAMPGAPVELAAHDCIRRRLSSGGFYRWEFEKAGREVAVDVKGSLVLGSDELAVRAAREGLGLAYVSEWQVEKELASGALVRVLEDWTPPYPGLCIYYPSRRHLPAALRAFLEIAKLMR
jgi:DNA-binding transcriptional LysR family regulator